MIGRRSGVTAAHCVYNTFDPGQTQGWHCDNGAVGGGTANTRGPNAGVCGTNRVYARWRFGVEDAYGYTGWHGASGNCARITIPTAYITNIQAAHASSNIGIWTLARWDYAAMSFTGCFSLTSHYGTFIPSDQDLLDAFAQTWGYPGNAPCPANSTNCSTNRRYLGASPPFTGAEIWGAGASGISRGSCTVVPGSLCPDPVEAHTIQGDIDTTPGQSGSAIYRTVNGVRQLMGTLTGFTTDTNVNIWHRWNTELTTSSMRTPSSPRSLRTAEARSPAPAPGAFRTRERAKTPTGTPMLPETSA